MNNVTISAFHQDDLEGVIEISKREIPTDFISSETFQHKVLLDPNFRPDGLPVAKLDGRVVGFMLGLVRHYPLEDAQPDAGRGWITLMAVDSECQHQGVGTSLLRRTMDYLRGTGASSVWVSPYAPNYFTPGIDEVAYPNAIEFLRKNGFNAAYRPLSMETSLFDFSIPARIEERENALSKEGVTFDTFRPEYILSLTEHLRAEFPGDWQRHLRESMIRIVQNTFSPDQLFVALSGGRCIGFCQHQDERFGPFGVASTERGRGIGGVLLFRCLHRMKKKGFCRAWMLWTDDRAAKLYAEAGFRETRRYSVLSRHL